MERNHFQLVRVGWADDTRLLDIKLQFDIKTDGKIWLQENQTDVAIDDELLKRGVPASEFKLNISEPNVPKQVVIPKQPKSSERI